MDRSPPWEVSSRSDRLNIPRLITELEGSLSYSQKLTAYPKQDELHALAPCVL
jgi:hypothetical protein